MNLIVVNESKLARRAVQSKLPLIQASVSGVHTTLGFGLGAAGREGCGVCSPRCRSSRQA